MNKFLTYTPDQLTEHFSNFIVDHLSYSMLRTMGRNEKEFERTYILGIRGPSGASALAGKAYHEALAKFFDRWREGKKMGLMEFTSYGYRVIDHAHPAQIETGKTYATVEEVKKRANQIFNSVSENFFRENDSYLTDIQRVVAIEERFSTFITVRGEDIPLPFTYIPDLIYLSKAGDLVIVDHKSKSFYTQEDEIHLSCFMQSKIYQLGVEAEIEKRNPVFRDCPSRVSAFHFFENKHSKNKDGTRQIRRVVVPLTECGELYEELLLEYIHRVLRAVQDPDWTYVINLDDPFSKGSDFFNLWLKTKIGDYSEFGKLSQNQKEFLLKRKRAGRDLGLAKIPKSVIERFTNPKKFISLNPSNMEKNLSPSEKIEHRLRFFGLNVAVAEIIYGYACDTFLLRVGAGVRIRSVIAAHMDIANALGVESVLIPHTLLRKNGESFIGVDVNRAPEDRRFAALPEENSYPRIPLGISNFGERIDWDLSDPSTPHLMISGATGSGKSVVIRSIIEAARRAEVDLHILDPKHEFTEFGSITDQRGIEEFIAGKVDEMNRIFSEGNGKKRDQIIIFDEAADAFVRERRNPEEEVYKEGWHPLSENILLLAQKARSAGIHLALAAQRFSTKILTGDVKANFTSRLALTCAKEVDSLVMIDQKGAERLAGKGDALFVSPRYPEPVRLQAYSSS